MPEQFTQKGNETYPVALTIAGSDSGGGAGIQADIRTFSAFGVYGTSAITALTAQNPRRVETVAVPSPDAVRKQIEAVFAEFTVKSVKTGMISGTENVIAIAETLSGKNIPLVIDPVMVSTSGELLSDDSAFSAMEQMLFPLAEWITPNIPEAERILGTVIRTVEDLKEAAAEIAEKYGVSTVVKGGHLAKRTGQESEPSVPDAVCRKGKVFLFTAPEIPLPDEYGDFLTHGSGCTFSAAMTACRAIELPWRDMIISAKAFVYGSIKEAVRPGEKICSMYPPAGSYRDLIKILS